MAGRISVKIGLAIGPFLESCLLSERTVRQMLATTIESVSGLDIRFFSKEELLSIRAEIDGELKRREKDDDGRNPLDRFAQQARRDVCCPACGSHRCRDEGIYRGRQRLQCSRCGTRFGYLSGKMMDGSKLSLMKVYQLVMFFTLDLPVWTISYLSKADQKTVQFWRYRLSDVSASYLQKAVLSDKIWIDETYWRISDHRLIQTHPDGKSLRGLSCNLVCVLVGYDIHGHYYCHVMEKRGSPNSEELYGSLRDHIRYGSKIIHDGSSEHRLLIERLGLDETVVKSKETDRQKKELIEPIDNMCALLKFEVRKHKGINTQHLAELLPWFLLKATKIARYGTKEAVEQIMTLLFDEDKTEGYYERFHTRRKFKK